MEVSHLSFALHYGSPNSNLNLNLFHVPDDMFFFIGVVNIGRMKIAGLDFESESEKELLPQDM